MAQSHTGIEIIDLTSSTPEPILVVDSDGNATPDLDILSTPPPSIADHLQPQKPSRRGKKRKLPAVGDSQHPSAPISRADSTEDGEVNEGASLGGRRAHKRGKTSKSRSRKSDIEEQRHMPGEQRSREFTPISTSDGTSNFFCIDVNPASLPAPADSVNFKPAGTEDKSPEAATLLLPAHVSVFGTTPVEILPPAIPVLDAVDYIEYIDYDDRKEKDVLRYFEEPVEGSTKPKVVCKNCGAEGEHKTAACPVKICLTCGARNEHSTRGCPISKTCFNCGMKGHLSQSCPNRHSSRPSWDNDCGRCGSSAHKANECPTLWRLYEYLNDDERETLISGREEKRSLTFGQGGEGYIASDEWCYNCGGFGHWGDDCTEIPHPSDFPHEPSAFSAYNTMSGPFSDPNAKPASSSVHVRGPRDWEEGASVSDGWGNGLPQNVGQQGRRKDIAKLAKKARELELDDDPDDWFGNPRNARNLGDVPARNGARHGAIPTGPKKMSFGSSFSSSGRSNSSLLARLGDDHGNSGSRGWRDERRDSKSSHKSLRHKADRAYDISYRRSNGSDKEGDRDRYHRQDHGPRYKGGYSK